MKWEDLARTFRERHYTCAGTSETWFLTGDGTHHDEASNVYLIHKGLPAEEQKAGGKWGVAFCLSAPAFKRWKQGGQQLERTSARAMTIMHVLTHAMIADELSLVHTHTVMLCSRMHLPPTSWIFF
jgi:hypothetical protein